jgi:hypothetical protein
MRTEPANAPRATVNVLPELLVPVSVALSTIPAGFEPSVKLAPHSEVNSLAKDAAVLGKSPLRTLYASLMQLEQVILEGMLVVETALAMTVPILLRLSVPRID